MIGYVLLLLHGLAIAVATFVCSMGNVPVARFLKAAGVPLGANTTYIYGDLLILPLVRIYRRSFPPGWPPRSSTCLWPGHAWRARPWKPSCTSCRRKDPPVSFDTIANAIALAVIAVLTVVCWYGKRHHGRQHPPGSQP